MFVVFDFVHLSQELDWNRAGLGPSPGWGLDRVGAHMGPYGSSWTGLGGFRKLSVRLLDQFRTFRIQNWYFDEISK